MEPADGEGSDGSIRRNGLIYDPDLDLWYDPRPGAYGPDDPGGGPWDEETQGRWWYYAPAPKSDGLTWEKILSHWDDIEWAFQEVGIDLSSGILSHRSWRWFKVRVLGLVGRRSSNLASVLGIVETPTSNDQTDVLW